MFLDEFDYTIDNMEQYKAIRNALNTSNKKQAIQSLIDNKIIAFNPYM